VLAVELTRLARVLLDKEGEPEQRWEKLCAVSQELSRLRRDEQRAVQTRIREEQWALAKAKQEAEAEEREAAKRKERKLAPIRAAQEVNLRTMLNGGGERGRQVAQYVLEAEYGLEPGTLDVERLKREHRKPRRKVNPVKSDLIQPEVDGRSRMEDGKLGSDPIQPKEEAGAEQQAQAGNPGESDPIQPEEGVRKWESFGDKLARAQEELRTLNEEAFADGEHGSGG